VKRINSNIMEKHQFKWLGAKCDFVDDGRVFIAKGQVVACDPQEIVLNYWLGEDHVGLCILYLSYDYVNSDDLLEMVVGSNNS